MKKKYLLYSILLANMAALPAGAALSASADNVPTHDNVPGVDQKSIRDSLAYEAYLDSISRQFDLTEVVVTGTRTPKFLKDTPIQTRVIGSKISPSSMPPMCRICFSRSCRAWRSLMP